MLHSWKSAVCCFIYLFSYCGGCTERERKRERIGLWSKSSDCQYNFETGSLWTEAQHFSSIAWPLSPQDPFASVLQHCSSKWALTSFLQVLLLVQPRYFFSVFEMTQICYIAEGRASRIHLLYIGITCVCEHQVIHMVPVLKPLVVLSLLHKEIWCFLNKYGLYWSKYIEASWRNVPEVNSMPPKDLGLFPSTHRTHNHIRLQSRWPDTPSCLCRHQVHIWYTDIRVGKTPTHIKKYFKAWHGCTRL